MKSRIGFPKESPLCWRFEIFPDALGPRMKGVNDNLMSWIRLESKNPHPHNCIPIYDVCWDKMMKFHRDKPFVWFEYLVAPMEIIKHGSFEKVLATVWPEIKKDGHTVYNIPLETLDYPDELTPNTTGQPA